MATAKLWLNSSGNWVTTETNYSSTTTGSTSSYAQASVRTRIIVYDDYTIKLDQFMNAWANQGVYQMLVENSLVVKSGDTTLYSGTLVRASSRVTDITNYLQVYWKWVLHPISSAGYGPEGSETKDVTFVTPFYTVTYNANGGSGAPAATKGIKNYESTLSASAPTRSGYVFKGWATSSTAVSAEYSAGGELPARTTDITLYAVWNRLITIDAPEGVTITLGSNSRKNNSGTYEYPRGTYALSMLADTGWLIKTRSTNEDEVVVPTDDIFSVSATSVRVGCFIDTGTAMTQHLIYIDNGSGWELYLAYRDTGTGWELLY